MPVFVAFLEILGRPTGWAIMIGMIQLMGPIWIAFFMGMIVGWAWKPRWAPLGNCKFDFSAPPSSPPTLCKGFGSVQSLDSCKDGAASCSSDDGLQKQMAKAVVEDDSASSSESGRPLITNEELKHLCHLVERRDGGPPWKHMMDRSAHNMTYQAWQREPQGGPPQYCSRTVYEDATPELLRDFFWDDDFRLKWDDMLTHASILEECPTTGTMVVHWVRKFPFFCSDREYVIGRRIWESGRSYYCVTKGVPSLSPPRKDKPRRVDLFYSSWFIQAVESRKVDGDLSACEVILFHHEDMGIPWEIAKFGVRQGMWGAVNNIERGFRAYQKHRATGAPLSRHSFMAQINTKLDPNYLKALEDDEESPVTPLMASPDEKPKGVRIPKLLIIGGAIVVACTLDRGLLTKTLVYGVARKFGNIGRGGGPLPRTG